MLASTTGNTGRVLRQEISEIVFTVSNIREILRYAENHIMLQKLGIEVLTSLAMDEEARERIGATGGMIKELLRLFFREGCDTQQQIELRTEAGEALAMLALENERNCERILKGERVIDRLVACLADPTVRISSIRILKNLCAFNGTEFVSRLRGVADALPTVLNAIMVEEMKLLEVSLGLAVQIFNVISYEEYMKELEKSGIREDQFAERLVKLLNTYSYPSIKVPRIRRFLIELAIWLMRSDEEKYVTSFKSFGLEAELENVAETMSELECFNVFSGSVGLSRHNRALSSLVEAALEWVREG
ncbi:uncharacterized protein A4U43_C02F13280 [Asparagus officinalis]|uniref:Uncharacterized protein n=1 Tax=Asparagus officinalis TaxID=4686 RepID=A0A5P1FIT0_ASPOF|nr:uncharacterized protein A4U43_C02F13280 [Asparagus officinalis]